jgi:hypothetical protein
MEIRLIKLRKTTDGERSCLEMYGDEEVQIWDIQKKNEIGKLMNL